MKVARGQVTLSLCASLFLFACQTTSSAPDATQAQPIIKSATILPAGEKASDRVLSGKVLVPLNIVNLTEIVRPRVEVREGPGVEFPLLDTLLVEGTKVLAFGRIGVWQKVYLPDRKLQGWVHHQTLGETKKGDNLLEVELEQLPRVFAVRPIHKGFAAGDMTKVAVDFPRGRAFTALRETDRMVLVLLDGTQSVIWLAKKDAQ